MIKDHRRSWKVKEGHGWSFPITRLTFQVRKVMGGVGEWVVCRIIVSAPVPVPFLWTLDLGPEFGTGLGLELDNIRNIDVIRLSEMTYVIYRLS